MELTRVISDLTDAELSMLDVIQNRNPEQRSGKPATRAEAIRVAIRAEAARIQRKARK